MLYAARFSYVLISFALLGMLIQYFYFVHRPESFSEISVYTLDLLMIFNCLYPCIADCLDLTDWRVEDLLGQQSIFNAQNIQSILWLCFEIL